MFVGRRGGYGGEIGIIDMKMEKLGCIVVP